MTEETRYWLLTGEVPTGPATVGEIHTRIAQGTMTWQTKVCRVGDANWVPFLDVSGLSTVAGTSPPTPVISESVAIPSPQSTEPPREINVPNPLPQTRVSTRRQFVKDSYDLKKIVIFLTVIGVVYFSVKSLWPKSPREVSELFNSAQTAEEARKYSTSYLSRAIDEMFINSQPPDPNDTFEWTHDAPVPGTNNQYYVGCQLKLFIPEAGRRVQIEAVFHCLNVDGWKVNDVIIFRADGQALPQPFSLAQAFPNPHPIGATTPAPPTSNVKEWYEKPENRVKLSGGLFALIYGFFKTGAGKSILAGIAAVGAGLAAFLRRQPRKETA